MILSGIEILAKQKAQNRTSLDNLWPNVMPKYIAGSLIEINGSQDKSLLLQQIMALAALPLEYGGKNTKVIFIDLQHEFNIIKFAQLLENKIKPIAALHNNKVETIISQCFEAITHIPCFSSEQFELCLMDLDMLIMEDSGISMLVIDGLDSFYWEDCHEQLQKMATHYRKLCQRFKQLATKHNICCVLAVDEYYRKTKSPNYKNFAAEQLDYKINLKLEKNVNGDVIGRWLNDIPYTVENTGIQL